MITKNERLKCDCCGRITPFSQMVKGGGGSWAFVPASEVSYEEDYFFCKECTDETGTPVPNQPVTPLYCIGIY